MSEAGGSGIGVDPTVAFEQVTWRQSCDVVAKQIQHRNGQDVVTVPAASVP